MAKIDVDKSLFILNSNQQNEYLNLQYFDNFFSMVRFDFLFSSFANQAIADAWVYFYYPEVPLINSERTLMYILRHEILQQVMQHPTLKRKKILTTTSTVYSLWASVLATNIFLDCLRTIFQQFSTEELQLFFKFKDSTSHLFNPQFNQNDEYPKRYVHIETKLFKSLQEYIQLHSDSLEEKMTKAIRSIDQFSLIEKELFYYEEMEGINK